MFHNSKHTVDINNIDINKMLMFHETLYDNKKSYKYFIGYKSNEGIRPLRIMLSQMSVR